MTKTPKRPRDPNQLAKLVIDIASGTEAASQTCDAEPKKPDGPAKRTLTPKARRPSGRA